MHDRIKRIADGADEVPDGFQVMADRLDHLFKHHPPKGAEQVQSFERIRELGREFAYHVALLTPECGDQELSIQKIREAVMLANAAIALEPDCNWCEFEDCDQEKVEGEDLCQGHIDFNKMLEQKPEPKLSKEADQLKFPEKPRRLQMTIYCRRCMEHVEPEATRCPKCGNSLMAPPIPPLKKLIEDGLLTEPLKPIPVNFEPPQKEPDPVLLQCLDSGDYKPCGCCPHKEPHQQRGDCGDDCCLSNKGCLPVVELEHTQV